MNRLLLGCVLLGLSLYGCGGNTNTAPQNTNSLATAKASPEATPAVNGNQRAAATPAPAGNNAQGDVTGAYFAAGNLPSAFAEIEHLSLATIDENGNPAPLNGFIRPRRRSASDYRLVNPTLNGHDLTFTTAAVNGISYSFTGRFEMMRDFAANPPEADAVVLRGTLTKLNRGEVEAETPVSFTYSAGG